MRFVDYYNSIGLIFYCAAIVLTLISIIDSVRRKKRETDHNGERFRGRPVSDSLYFLSIVLLLMVGFSLRFWGLSRVPDGFNQDEASLGYDAWCILKYGVDRNGYRYPIYPITWGSGGGSPLIIYLIVLSEALFGRTVFAVRFVPAFFGCLTLSVFFLLLRETAGRKLAWIGLCVLTFCPWHIMLSRYTLDSNTTPFFVLLALLLLAKGADSKKTGWYLSASAVFSLCLYTYGSTTIVIPVFLILNCMILMKSGLLSCRQLSGCIFVFLLVALPIGVFYLINFLDLPAIMTPRFSINRLTSSRHSTFVTFGPGIGRELWGNLVYLIKLITIGAPDEEYLFSTEWYAELYRFTFPVTLLGMGVSFSSLRKISKREYCFDITVDLFFFCSFVFALFVQPRLSREVLLFPMLIYYEARGLQIITIQSRKAGRLLLAIMLGAGILFSRDYFGAAYRNETRYAYMPGYLDAVKYAEKIRTKNGEILSTNYNLKTPFVLALFASGTSPYDFQNTVVYQNEQAEFREAIALTHYRFQPLEELKRYISSDSVLIINQEELDHMDFEDWQVKRFGEFCVLDKSND